VELVVSLFGEDEDVVGHLASRFSNQEFNAHHFDAYSQ